VELAGGCETIGTARERSVTVSWQDVLRAEPEFLFVSCCGFNIERTEADLPLLFDGLGRDELPCVWNGNLFVLDGSAYLSRPGPRLVDALELMAWAMHPQCVQRPENVSGMKKVG
jgi:iron complex transport system substrate-binding protein